MRTPARTRAVGWIGRVALLIVLPVGAGGCGAGSDDNDGASGSGTAGGGSDGRAGAEPSGSRIGEGGRDGAGGSGSDIGEGGESDAGDIGSGSDEGLVCRDGTFYYHGVEFTSCVQCDTPSSCSFETDSFSTWIQASCEGAFESTYRGECERQCDPNEPCPAEGDQCVAIGNGTLKCQPAGGEGQACRLDASCDDDLECMTGACLRPGAEGNPCMEDRTCDGDLVCGYASSGAVCVARALGADFGEEDECCLTPLGEGQECRGQTCQAGLTCASPDFGSVTRLCTAAGDGGQPCLPDGTCHAGARCVGTTCVAEGGEGEACKQDGTCDPGFVCADDAYQICRNPSVCCIRQANEGELCGNSVARCVEPLVCQAAADGSTRCTVAGGLDQPCREVVSGGVTRCDAGLECGMDSTCMLAGGERQICRMSDPGNWCDAGLYCLSCAADVTCSSDFQGDNICLPARAEGQPCQASGATWLCDDPLECRQCQEAGIQCPDAFPATRICMATGGEGQACSASYPQCDAGLICRTDGTCVAG